MKRTNPRSIEEIEEFNQRPYREPVITKGNNVTIHPSTTLGGAGFTWARCEDGSILQAHNLGDIIIKDNVRIGEHCTIRRSTLPGTATIIGKGSVLISYVNVGHNCKIGKDSFLGPHVCLNGGVQIGDQCWISGHAVIHQQVKIGDGAVVGMGAVVTRDVPPGETVVGVPAMPIKFVGNYVHPGFKYGKNLTIGKFCVIEDGVVVGDNCTIKNYVELRNGTIIGDDCYIDSGVKSSGECRIGNRVTLRYDSIIARGCEIEDDVFISPQLMTENLDSKGKAIGGAHIGSNCFIGTNVTLGSGIKIANGTIIGTKANVRKTITDPGIYIGNPARKVK